MPWFSLLVFACNPESVESGVQVGSEGTTPPCLEDRTTVGFDEPAIDGRTTAELLAELDLAPTVSPTWWDKATRALTITVTAPMQVDYVQIVDDGRSKCDIDTFVTGSFEATLVTDDGLLDEQIARSTTLFGPSLGLGGTVPTTALGGTLDVDDLVEETVTTDQIQVLDVTFRIDTDGVSGVLSGYGEDGSLNPIEAWDITIATF